jgi:Tfp pilus assembly protein PilO
VSSIDVVCIGTDHQIGDFSSGVVSLDEWIKLRALANQASGGLRVS